MSSRALFATSVIIGEGRRWRDGRYRWRRSGVQGFGVGSDEIYYDVFLTIWVFLVNL